MSREVDVVRVDNKEIDGGIPILDYSHKEIHSGKHFYFTEYFALNSGEDREYLLTTADSDSTPHFKGIIAGTFITTVDLYEGTSLTGGTPITVFNNNRNSSNTAGMTVAHTPSGSGDGTKIYTYKFGNGSTPQTSTGGFVEPDQEIVLKKNTKYLLRVTSGTNANSLSVDMYWYEHEVSL